MAAFNGTEDGGSISSSGIPRGDTLFSSTYGGNDTVSIFSPSYNVHLGDGDDRLSGGIGGFAYVEAGNDRLNVFLWEGTMPITEATAATRFRPLWRHRCHLHRLWRRRDGPLKHEQK